MCLTSISIYIDHWKSIVKLGIKKSHEMISHILAWIVLLSEGEHEMSNKLVNLAQMTLIELYKKSHKRFMLRACPENASIGLKP
jgi:hypothetical protein